MKKILYLTLITGTLAFTTNGMELIKNPILAFTIDEMKLLTDPVIGAKQKEEIEKDEEDELVPPRRQPTPELLKEKIKRRHAFIKNRETRIFYDITRCKDGTVLLGNCPLSPCPEIEEMLPHIAPRITMDILPRVVAALLNRNKVHPITELHLNDNGLTTIPAELAGLTSLEKLFYQGNSIDPNAIPAEILALPKLKILRLTLEIEPGYLLFTDCEKLLRQAKMKLPTEQE